jgi:FlaA1/EpsC-like NDP-sugar epimerase
METRQEIIQKAYQLLIMMENATGFRPGEDFYKSVVASLDSAPEDELPKIFAEIAQIVTESVDRAAMAISEFKKDVVVERENSDRSQEMSEVATLLNF